MFSDEKLFASVGLAVIRMTDDVICRRSPLRLNSLLTFFRHGLVILAFAVSDNSVSKQFASSGYAK